jgi:hypothetical protein
MALPTCPSEIRARHNKMVGFTRRVMSDKRGTMSAECDGLRLTAYGPGGIEVGVVESAADKKRPMDGQKEKRT